MSRSQLGRLAIVTSLFAGVMWFLSIFVLGDATVAVLITVMAVVMIWSYFDDRGEDEDNWF